MFLKNKITLSVLAILSIFTLSLAIFISVSVPAESSKNQQITNVENSSSSSSYQVLEEAETNTEDGNQTDELNETNDVVAENQNNEEVQNTQPEELTYTLDVDCISDEHDTCSLVNTNGEIKASFDKEYSLWLYPCKYQQNDSFYVCEKYATDGALSNATFYYLKVTSIDLNNFSTKIIYKNMEPMIFYQSFYEDECGERLGNSFTGYLNKCAAFQPKLTEKILPFLQNWKLYTGQEL